MTMLRVPALALWAGNNEVHAIHQAVWGNLDPGDWGYAFFHDILPTAVEQHSPGTIYWPGCPWADSEERVNGVRDGDRHAWEVWHGVDVGAGGPSEFPDHGVAGLVVVVDRLRLDRQGGSTTRSVTGWIKRGPVGLIGHTKSDAAETVTSLLADLPGIPRPETSDPDAILAHLSGNGIDYITWQERERLDAHEVALGRVQGRERVKVVPRQDMIRGGRG
jgi:hypothetical protein